MIDSVISSNKIKANQRTPPKPSTQHGRKENMFNEVPTWQITQQWPEQWVLEEVHEYLQLGYLEKDEKNQLKKNKIKISMQINIVFSFKSFSLQHQYCANWGNYSDFYRSGFEQRRNGLMWAWLSQRLNINPEKRENSMWIINSFRKLRSNWLFES